MKKLVLILSLVFLFIGCTSPIFEGNEVGESQKETEKPIKFKYEIKRKQGYYKYANSIDRTYVNLIVDFEIVANKSYEVYFNNINWNYTKIGPNSYRAVSIKEYNFREYKFFNSYYAYATSEVKVYESK